MIVFIWCIFVVNSHNSSVPGEHWLCTILFCTKSSFFLLLWFEMYPNIQFTIGLLPVTSSLTQLQRLNTDVCRDYCVALGLAVARGLDMNSFVSYWKTKQDRDFIVETMIISMLTPSWQALPQFIWFSSRCHSYNYCYCLVFVYALLILVFTFVVL